MELTTSDYILFSNNSYLKKRDAANNCDLFFQQVSQSQRTKIRDIDRESLLFTGSRQPITSYTGRGGNDIIQRNDCMMKTNNNTILPCSMNTRLFNNITTRR